MGWDGEYVEQELEQYRDGDEPDYQDTFEDRYADVPAQEFTGSLEVGIRSQGTIIRSDIVIRFGGGGDTFTVLQGGDELHELEYDRYLEP